MCLAQILSWDKRLFFVLPLRSKEHLEQYKLVIEPKIVVVDESGYQWLI